MRRAGFDFDDVILYIIFIVHMYECHMYSRLPIKTEKSKVLVRKYQKFKKIQKNFNRLILCQLTIRFPPSELEKYNFLLASSMSKNLSKTIKKKTVFQLKRKK